MRRIALGLWTAYLLVFPFYVFPSGRPQPADLLLLLFAIVTFSFATRADRFHRRYASAVVWFAAWTTVVNIAWGVAMGDGAIAYRGLFYLYDAMVVVALLRLHAEIGSVLLRRTVHAIGISGIVQLALVLVTGVPGRRNDLFFNNPNQLAHFALLIASFALLGLYQRSFRPRMLTGYLSVSCLLILYSLSKAALIAIVFALGSAFVRKGKHAFVAVLLILCVVPMLPGEVRTAVVSRIQGLGSQSDDSLAGRGYDRILNHPEYLLLGAGEGSPERFETVKIGELHSTMGTIAFSYGLVGLLFFLRVMWLTVRADLLARITVLIPIFLYGLTHHGARWPLFWALLALVYVARRPDEIARRRRRRLLPVSHAEGTIDPESPGAFAPGPTRR